MFQRPSLVDWSSIRDYTYNWNRLLRKLPNTRYAWYPHPTSATPLCYTSQLLLIKHASHLDIWYRFYPGLLWCHWIFRIVRGLGRYTLLSHTSCIPYLEYCWWERYEVSISKYSDCDRFVYSILQKRNPYDVRNFCQRLLLYSHHSRFRQRFLHYQLQGFSKVWEVPCFPPSVSSCLLQLDSQWRKLQIELCIT